MSGDFGRGATRARRSGGGSRPLDVSWMREVLSTGKLHAAIGVVFLAPGASRHYEVFDDSDGSDVYIDVQLMPNAENRSSSGTEGDEAPTSVFARLGAGAGAAGGGVWRIPPVGTELLVVLPGGEVDGDPVAVCSLSTGALPDALKAGGGDDQLLVVVGPKVRVEATGGDVVVVATGDVHVQAGSGKHVVVDDGAGGGEALVKRGEFNAHTHAAAPGVVCVNGSPWTGVTAAPTAPATGTTVLTAK